MPRAAAGDYELAYETLGDGEPDLVFHWGMFGDRSLFLPLAARLEGCGTRHVVDGRGYGASDAPTQPYTLEDYAEHIAAFLRRVIGGPAVLVGQSMGAMTFLRLALSHPELVRALILADTSAAPEEPRQLPRYDKLLGVLIDDGLTPKLLDVVARTSLMAPRFMVAEPARVAAWRAAMLAVDIPAFLVQAHAVFDRGDLRHRLGEITAPALVLYGSLDVATPPARSRELAAGLGGRVEIVEISGAAHFAPWERPQEAAAAVRQFLAALR